MKKKKVEKEVYVDECDICGLEIVGTSESQVKYNLRIHKQQKHSDKEKEKEQE